MRPIAKKPIPLYEDPVVIIEKIPNLHRTSTKRQSNESLIVAKKSKIDTRFEL